MGRRFIAIIALWLSAAANAATRDPLTFCIEEAPQRPWTQPDGTGLAIDLLALVQQRLGEEFQYVIKPWRRCLEETRLGLVDGAVAAAATPERRSYARFPLRPDGEPDAARAMFVDRFDVYLRNGSGAGWDGQTLTFGGRPVVLAQRGYAVVEFLHQKGITVTETASSATDALRHLTAGLFDMAILQGAEAAYVYRSNPRLYASVARAAVSYLEAPMYLMVSTAAYQRDTDRIDTVWREIGRVKKSAAFKRLENAALAN